MKTKILHKQEKNINFDKNLLNNQNYILWKTEKKKLLSKFFVEKSIKYIYKIFTYFYSYWPLVIFLIWTIFLISYSILLIIFSHVPFGSKIFYIWFIPFIIYVLYVWRDKLRVNLFKINKFSDFIFRKEKFQIFKYTIYFLKFLFQMMVEHFGGNINYNYNIKNYMWNILYVIFIPIFLFWIVFLLTEGLIFQYRIIIYLISLIFFDYVSFISLIFFPFIFIYQFVFTIILFILG